MISQQEGPFGFVDPADFFGRLELNQRITGFVFDIFSQREKSFVFTKDVFRRLHRCYRHFDKHQENRITLGERAGVCRFLVQQKPSLGSCELPQ